MKIAIAHYSICSDISGVTSWLVDFCGRLVEANHHVVVHLHHFGDDPETSSILPSLQRLGIETHGIVRTASLEDDTCHTLNFLNHVQPDLFLPQCLHAHYCAAAHAGRQGLPWVFTMHSDDPDYWCVAEALTPEDHGGTSVCVSKFLADEMRKRAVRTNPTVIPYGVTSPSGRARFSDQPFRVVYSGRLENRQKCIHQVVRTLINAASRSARIEGDFIGDGPDRSACERLVGEAGLSDRIRFHGRLSPEQVGPLVQRCQAILLMSNFEGLPVALLEAMALGVVPVVRSIASGIPELVQSEHTGLLVPDDPHAAADALLRLSQDPVLWQRCSANAGSLVETRYGADHAFCLWQRLIAQQRCNAEMQYPLTVPDLQRNRTYRDRRLYRFYDAPPAPFWARLHPRRLVARLRRMAYGTGS